MSSKGSSLPCKKRKASHDSSISTVAAADAAAPAGDGAVAVTAKVVVAATTTTATAMASTSTTATATATATAVKMKRPRKESSAASSTQQEQGTTSSSKSGGGGGGSHTADFFSLARGRHYSLGDCSYGLPVDDLPDCASIVNLNTAGASVALEGKNLKPAAAAATTTETPSLESSTTSTNAAAAANKKPAASFASSRPAAAAAADGDASSHDDTFASSGHRLLMEAIMMKTVADATSSVPYQASQGQQSSGMIPAFRDRLDSIHSFVHQRSRLESWGGMSELSFTGIVNTLSSNNDDSSTSVPTRILLQQSPTSLASPSTVAAAVASRGRLDSLASNSVEANYDDEDDEDDDDDQEDEDEHDDDGEDGSGGSSNANMQQTIQAYVAAAMATVGDELNELAGIIEHVASEAYLEDDFFQHGNGQSRSNSIDLLDGNDSLLGGSSTTTYLNRPRSQSVSSVGKLSVDLDAVQAAVDAGEAASQTLGLKELPDFAASTLTKRPAVASSQEKQKQKHQRQDQRKKPPLAFAKRQLPLKRDRTGSQTSHDTNSNGSKGSIPLKKRAKRPSHSGATASAATTTDSTVKTPRTSNAAKRKRPSTTAPVKATFPSAAKADSPPAPPPLTASSSAAATTPAAAVRGEDRWEVMYECLLQFAAAKRVEATKNLPDTQANEWVWDGNVPTNATTADGQKIGRWVNNQRTAKQKGKLRTDREEKLIATGLKWFVIPPDAWDDMFTELTLYVAGKTADGNPWDGNVPTNYQITGRTWTNNGTEKNLGRWVNRQRDMYQSGKLKRERQEKLERLGLKWPKNAVMWDEMRQLLADYADQQRRSTGRPWNGRVPVDYQTPGDPPRCLGKWVHKQRSARARRKLQKNHEEQLNQVGLQWDDADNGDAAAAAAVVPITATSMMPPPPTTTTKQQRQQQQQQQTPVVAVASKPDDVDPLQVVSISMALLGDL